MTVGPVSHTSGIHSKESENYTQNIRNIASYLLSAMQNANGPSPYLYEQLTFSCQTIINACGGNQAVYMAASDAMDAIEKYNKGDSSQKGVILGDLINMQGALNNYTVTASSYNFALTQVASAPIFFCNQELEKEVTQNPVNFGYIATSVTQLLAAMNLLLQFPEGQELNSTGGITLIDNLANKILIEATGPSPSIGPIWVDLYGNSGPNGLAEIMQTYANLLNNCSWFMK